LIPYPSWYDAPKLDEKHISIVVVILCMSVGLPCSTKEVTCTESTRTQPPLLRTEEDFVLEEVRGWSLGSAL
jgi:hypothetical protein